MAKQTFTTGQVLTAAQMTSLQQTAMGGGDTTAKTVSYVLVAADAGTTVAMNSGSATTITVNTSLFSAGDSLYIQNRGSGVCTITAGTATVTTASSLALAQYEGGTLYFTGASAAIFFKSDGAAASSGGLTLINAGGTTLSTGTTTVSTIPATYKNLFIYANDYYTSVPASLYLRVNTDTGNNYAWGRVQTITTTVTGSGTSATSEFDIGLTGDSSSAKNLGQAFIQILRYTDTGRRGVFTNTYSFNGTTYTSRTLNGTYDSASAISSISLSLSTGTFSGGKVYVYGQN